MACPSIPCTPRPCPKRLRRSTRKWIPSMTTTKSKLGEALTSSRLVITAECLPPRTGGAEAVKQLAALLPSKLDAVVVADNPEKIGGSALACASLLVREGRPTILSMVTRDRNRIALE